MIKRYKLKDGISHEDLLQCGCKEGSIWVQPDGIYYISKNLVDEVGLDIAFPDDLSKWNDFEYVLVLDEDFGQPYTPFYRYAQTRVNGGKPFKFLQMVINRYNKVMDSLPFLEEVSPKKLVDFLS